MLPSDLTGDSFRGYPPQAREMAAAQVALLRELPMAFVPLLLRELISYDWKFPAERKELDQQFAYLTSQPAEARRPLMGGFAKLRIPSELEQSDWVNAPGQFSEQLTTHLWATRQIDAFRSAAIDYIQKVHAAAPREPLPVPRLGMVALGHGVAENEYRLFRKLRPHGVYYSNVRQQNGIRLLVDVAAARAKAHPVPYAHWYIEGGTEEAVSLSGLTCISYNSLAPVRTTLQDKMRKAYSSGMGPEAFRTMLAKLRPEELRPGAADDAILSRFQVSVLTEGSGTQVFSTTFVQWSAREALRRAEPLTLLMRFASRQRMRPMNELLETRSTPELDPRGSLVDADMGAYYTWLNQERLEGARAASFLVWFEDHNEAVAIAPSLSPNTESHDPVDLGRLVKQLV